MARMKQANVSLVVRLLENEIDELQKKKEKSKLAYDRWTNVENKEEGAVPQIETPDTTTEDRELRLARETLTYFKSVIDETEYEFFRANQRSVNTVGE